MEHFTTFSIKLRDAESERGAGIVPTWIPFVEFTLTLNEVKGNVLMVTWIPSLLIQGPFWVSS